MQEDKNLDNFKEEPERQKKDFLCVGLGASAGGVKALQEFFASMPPNSGMAFVVILHLSPQHESSLPQILQAQTTMPVVQVNETHTVEPNRVYVIPPNSQLEMLDGKIYCTPPEKKTGTRVAIDVFFRTLAEAYEKNAVCVVLSGTGSDGTLGLKRIKESNGFAIVQSPEDSEYDQMPRSAIATGLVDWILSVRQMPEKLIHFRESSERLHLTNGADAEKVADAINAEDSLREILTILRVHTGHDFTNYKKPTLIRRIARHLQIHELEDLPAYVKYLHDNAEEIQFLQRNLLINVTNFFRDGDAFTALEKEVVARIFADKTARDTVRVWTAGCASGEEAYSVAMLLSEYAEKHPDPPKIMVFATDIDDETIVEAREHSYPETIEADVSPERLKRFFVKDGSRYRIKKDLRGRVLFALHNVLQDPPFSRLDLVTCRNLLIYFNQEAQKRVMDIFHFALNPGGFLLLGNSESAESVPEFFEATDKKLRLYRSRRSPRGYHAPPGLPAGGGSWQVSQPLAARHAERVKAPSLGEVHFKLLESLAPPSVLVNENFDVVYMSQSLGRFLRFAGGEPTNNLLKLVNPDLLPDLRAALFTAQRDNQSAEFTNVRVRIEDKETLVNINVRSVGVIESGNDNFLLVIFEEASETKSLPKAAAKKSGGNHTRSANGDHAVGMVINRLEDELQRARLNLRATIEQHEISIEELKASNEELQAINEELRSTTEELETSKEELQSVNEEMQTVNGELKDKIDEAARNNSDLQNLIVSTDIATIFLDCNFRIKRFSPLVERIFNIKRTDIGRPLKHFTHNLDYDNLMADAADVLKTLNTVEREISDHDNRYFLARFSPYRTIDERIEGVVLNFLEITRYKQAEIALHETEEKYRIQLEQEVEARTAEFKASKKEFLSLVENTPDVITRWDKNLRLLYANSAFQLKTGVANETLFGKTNREMGQPEEIAAPYMETLRNVLESGEAAEHFNSFPTPRGEEYLHSRIVPEKNERGETETVLAIARDVNKPGMPRRVEESLSESEFRFRAIVNQTAAGVAELDLQGNHTLVNETYCKTLGYTRTELLKLNIRDVTHPEDLPLCLELFEKAIKTGEPLVNEKRLIRKDGEIVWISDSIARVTDINHKPSRVATVAISITELKRAEEAIRKSEEYLQMVIESAKDYAIITFDLEGRITRWNSGAEQIFGYPEREILGQTGDILFTPSDRALGIPGKEIQTALEKGRAEDERWHVRKDGTRFFASGVIQPLKDGKLEGFVKIARDQTEQMQAEKAVQEKETLRRLVSTQEDERRRIARDIHDHLGQQMTTLRLKLDAIRKMCGDDEICAKIEEAQRTAASLDADVDFIAWELRPAALDELGLRATLNNFVREWSHHTQIEAEFHVSGLNKARLAVETETNLYRIAQEALNNIYKHAKAKMVSVLLERRKDQIVLIVEDDGKGFNAEDKKTRQKGIGLIGMAERARIVGGEFHVESQKGKGTTVFARVPIGERDE